MSARLSSVARTRPLLRGVLGIVLAVPALTSSAQRPVAIGLDHIPVVVRELDSAAATYRAMGFALKPGQPHPNGLRNTHVKFPDGAGIELLTAPSATDELTAQYVDLLRSGEGPAFAAFHARDTARLHAALRAGGYAFREEGGFTRLLAPEFSFLFFVRDNRSPTDRPEHFAHANGATALRAIWVGTEHGAALVRLLVSLGGRPERRTVLVPEPAEATVVDLSSGEVVVLPPSHRAVPGRPVFGAGFRVSDLAAVRRALEAAKIPLAHGAAPGTRLTVGPNVAHGLWIEFRDRS
ncbi:MAG: VOC family protein [Vicinamibacterales bacterium]